MPLDPVGGGGLDCRSQSPPPPPFFGLLRSGQPYGTLSKICVRTQDEHEMKVALLGSRAQNTRWRPIIGENINLKEENIYLFSFLMHIVVIKLLLAASQDIQGLVKKVWPIFEHGPSEKNGHL